MVAVDALHDFALTVCAAARFPAGNAICTRKPFLAAILDGIINTSVFIGVHIFLAGSHMACTFNTVSVCPARDFYSARDIMIATVINAVFFTPIVIFVFIRSA